MRWGGGSFGLWRRVGLGALLVLAGGVAGAGGAPAVHAADGAPVNVINGAYDPGAVRVWACTDGSMGNTVVWTNQDSAPHTVTSDAPGQFDSGPLQPGQTYRVTFYRIGTYAYHSTGEATMHGTVVVDTLYCEPPLPPGISVSPPFVQEPPASPSTPAPPRVGGGGGAAYLHRLGDG